MKKTDFFQTYDLCLATALFYYGHKPEAIEVMKPTSRCIFYYHNSPELLEVVQKYWANDLKGEIRCLFTAYKYLRTKVQEQKQD